jgi:hypothetical protein
MSELPISEQFRLVAKKWVDAEAAASMLEETKSAVLAKMMAGYGDIPVSRSEMNVKASPAWTEHIEKMVQARTQASLLKVQMEYLRMKFSELQSAEASKRAEMRLT